MSSFAYAATFYRFYHIQRNIDLIPGLISVTLHQLSLVIIMCGVAWGIIVAMIERESHRFGEYLIRIYDLKGIVLTGTTCFLTLIEVLLSTNNLGYLSRDVFQHEARPVYHPTLILTV